MRSALLQRGVAEFVGTFTLIFVGAGAIIQTGGGNLTAIGLAHGLAIGVMASAVGHITPPVGLCLFVGMAISGLSMEKLIVPLLPFLITTGQTAFIASLVVAFVALFIVGAAVSLVTGKSMIFSGIRQVVIGAGAAAVTYAVGKVIGANI